MSEYDEPASTAEITLYVAQWLRHKGHPDLARQWETELKIATASVELAAKRQPGESRQAWRNRLAKGGWPETTIDELLALDDELEVILDDNLNDPEARQ